MSNTFLRVDILLQAIDKATAPIKALMGNQGRLAAEVNTLTERQRTLQQVQSNIDSYRNLATQTRATGDALKAAQDRVKTLALQMRGTREPSAEMQQAFAAARQSAAALKEEYGALRQKKHALQGSLRQSGVDTQNLASHQRLLKRDLHATSDALATQQKKLDAINQRKATRQANAAGHQEAIEHNSRRAGMGQSLLAAGGAAGIAGALVFKPLQAFADGEQSAAELKAAMLEAGGTVGPAYEALRAQAEALGKALPGSAETYEALFRQLISQGMSAQAVLDGGGEAAAHLAIATHASAAEASSVVGLFDRFKLKGNDLLMATDQVQRLVHAGQKISEVKSGFEAVLPTLNALGVNSKDAITQLTPLFAMTGSAGEAYNKLVTQSMDGKKVDKANTLLKGSGIKLDFTDSKGQFAGVDHMMAQILKLNQLKPVQRTSVLSSLFGDDKDVSRVLKVLGEGGEPGLAEMKAKLARQAAMKERVAIQLETLKHQWETASEGGAEVLSKMGETIAPDAKAASEMITQLTGRISAWISENPALTAGIIKVAAGVALVIVVVGGFLVALAGVLGPMLIVRASFAGMLPSITTLSNGLGWLMRGFGLIGGGFFKLMGLLRVVFAALMANPILAIVGLLAMAALYIWNNWDTLGPKFWALWDSIKAGAGMAVDWVVEKWHALVSWFSGLGDSLMEAGGRLIDGLLSGILERWEALKTTLSGMVEGLKSLLGLGDATLKLQAELPDKAPALPGPPAGLPAVPPTPPGVPPAPAAGPSLPPKPPLPAASLPATPLASHPLRTRSADRVPALPGRLAGALSPPVPSTLAGQPTGASPGLTPPVSRPQGPLRAAPPVGAGTTVNQPITIQVTPTPGMNEQALAQMIGRQVQQALARQAAAAPPRRAALYDQE